MRNRGTPVMATPRETAPSLTKMDLPARSRPVTTRRIGTPLWSCPFAGFEIRSPARFSRSGSRKPPFERERLRHGTVEAEQREPLLPLIDRGNAPRLDPPKNQCGPGMRLEPLPSAAEHGDVLAAIDVLV